MIVIVGGIVVTACVLAGFMMAGGHVGALIHPSEFVTIGGASMGALIMMSPKKVIKDLMHGLLATIKPMPYNKAMYEELFKLCYDLLRAARRDGLLSLEDHVNNPHESKIINKYPLISKDHHAVKFLCDGLMPIVEAVVKPEEMPGLLEAELKVIEEEHHAPISVLSKTADALPGFGIVAAVLGIVVTMGAIDGPVEEVGHKVGAALVGTFLGILLSYGFFAPLASRMEFMGHSHMAFFKTMTSLILAFTGDNSPKVAVDQVRRSVGTEVRPSREEMEKMFADADASG
jgi:chemotaxis protein MotA